MNYNLKLFCSLTNTWLHEMRKNFQNTPSLWSGAPGERLFTIQNVLELTILFLFRVDHVIPPSFLFQLLIYHRGSSKPLKTFIIRVLQQT